MNDKLDMDSNKYKSNDQRIIVLETQYTEIKDLVKEISKGERAVFKSIWASLPICLALFGGYQYSNTKNYNDQIDKAVNDAKEKIKEQEARVTESVKIQDQRISEIISNEASGNLTNVIVASLVPSDGYLKAYPIINATQLPNNIIMYTISFTSYIGIKSKPGEQGYLIASYYKWGGPLAEKMAISRDKNFDPNYINNNYGYINQYNPYILVSEYGSTLLYKLNIEFYSCKDAKNTIKEMQSLGPTSWLEIIPVINKIRNKQQAFRFSIAVVGTVQDC